MYNIAKGVDIMGKTSTASKNKYNEKAYDRIALLVNKGQREIIKAHAEAQGKSLNAYINDLIVADMAKTASCDSFVADGHGIESD